MSKNRSISVEKLRRSFSDDEKEGTMVSKLIINRQERRMMRRENKERATALNGEEASIRRKLSQGKIKLRIITMLLQCYFLLRVITVIATVHNLCLEFLPQS